MGAERWVERGEVEQRMGSLLSVVGRGQRCRPKLAGEHTDVTSCCTLLEETPKKDTVTTEVGEDVKRWVRMPALASPEVASMA